ncbi:hypothetical protein SAMN05720469_10552 [Fibrobacter intestinalis]|uniref:Uncharacterized protein n=1 Tax=Fibrobacter intestinalis TaxID=28122 RepID=A0A1M6S691_9BACT|nr:hypothetical protein [Fibrobacter intestinalis]SHK40210.1 hypothetical protein SAMN05720469_10552 [Fibrobacter intestinalis]
MLRTKKGVSLITVLLFMLVATIAATATYRWITREGESSASRMVRSEAYMSAVSGIEAARSWMTYHGNDVGALIADYFANDKKPILLDSALAPLNRSGQNYNVWLTGVNTEKNSYKLKIFSEGEARNGAKHSEVAILNVNGLYRVQIPQEGSEIDFNEAFFGSLASAGDLNVNSIIVNGSPNATNGGGAAFSTVNVTDYLFVTGTAEFNSSTNVGTMYVEGDFMRCTNVNVNGDVFVGGKWYATMGGSGDVIAGDLYVVGGIDLTTQGPRTQGGCGGGIGGTLSVGGNLTSEGPVKMPNNNGTWNLVVGQNLVVNDAMIFNTGGYSNQNFPLEVGLNTYIEDGISGTHNYVDVAKVKFGTSSSTDTYIPNVYRVNAVDAEKSGDPSTYFQSALSGDIAYFSITGQYHNGGAPTNLNDWKANRLDSLKERIKDGGTAKGCQTDKYVEDPIQFNKDILTSEVVLTQGNHAACPALDIWKQWPSDWVAQVNACYATAESDEKYDDTWLVIDLTDPMFATPGTLLDGKYVFIIHSDGNSGNEFVLPAMTEQSKAFIYFPDGWNKTIRFYKGDSDNNHYFIFSDKDIKDFQMNVNHPMQGSIFMSNCASLNTGTHNAALSAVSDKDFNDMLATSGIICNNDGSGKCNSNSGTGGSSGGSGGSSTTSSGAYDSYYIATAPQLGITLESQYEAKEKAPSANNYNGISPSILVLPRVIYLNRDPVGQLSDYYTVINLNGANETPSASNVSCSPSGINTAGLLYQNDALIDEGIYECAYSSTGSYGTVPFYVVISGTAGTTPAVKFKESAAEIAPGGTCAEVTLVVPSSTRANPISVDVSVSSLPSDWTMTALSGVSERSGTTDLNRIFTASATPSATGASEIALFKVCANSGAAQGTMLFQLVTPCEGCIIGSPNLEIVAVTGHAEVERKSLEAYCAQTENVQICEDEGWDEKAHYPDCDDFISGSWVEASGLNCSVEEVNNKWSCGTNLSIGLKGVSSVPDYCERIIPSENNSILSPENDQTYPLYASVKRKPYTLTVKLEGASSNDAKIHVYESATGTYPSSPSYTCTQSDGACDYTVYAGSRIKLSYEEGSDKFSYWKCLGDNCPVNISNSSDYSLLISADNEVTAKFNDKDKHCFYEDFLSLKAFCSTGETNCIENCTLRDGCDISKTSANWQMMFAINKKSNATPVIEDGAIYTTNTKNANNKNGSPILVLRAADAGSNGTMTSLFQTTILASNKKNEFLNSGIIFRANATMSEYLILNVFGVGSGDEGVLTARICKGAGQGIQNSSGCIEKTLLDVNGVQRIISPTTMIKLSMTVSSSTLTVSATVSSSILGEIFDISSTVGATFDLSSYGMNDLEHQYVGFALADSPFRVYDLGWESFDYGDACWETPKLSCSFKANYLGSIVPKDSLVTPWVGTSSWFSENGCTLKFYYNGWDNQTSYNGFSWGGYGFSLVGSYYQFSEGGLHGVPYSGSFIWHGITYNYTGIRQNVVVQADCPSSLNSSLSGDTASCGTFMVGEVTRCGENAVILSGSEEYVPAETDKEFLTGAALNLREATLYFHIANLDENATITVYLKDSLGNFSLPGYLTTNGDVSLNVNVMSDLETFDPQAVTAVILKGTSYFYVSYIASSCPYALGIASCGATYNGTSWKIDAKFTNPEGVASNGCSVTPSSSEINGLSDVTCPTDGSGFSISDPDLYTRLNNGGADLSYSFVVKAKSSNGGEVTCTTDEVTFKPAAITCSVAKSEVFTGAGVPKLTYRIDNCPSSGCDYTLKLEGTGESVSGTTKGNSETWSPTANTTPPLSAGEYFYKISSMGKTASCNFTVKEASPASVSNCRIEGNTFKADVTPASNGSAWSIVVAVHDQLGNVVNAGSTTSGTGSSYSYVLPPFSPKGNDETYSALLYLNGNGVASCQESFTVPGTGVSSSSAQSSSSAVEVSSSSSSVEASSSSAGAITATCTFESSVGVGNTAKLNISSINGQNVDSVNMILTGEGVSKTISVNRYWNAAVEITAPSSVSNYEYVLYYEGNVVCRATLNVISLLTCSTDKSEVPLGESFTLSTVYAGDAWNCDLSGNGATSACNSSHTISPTALGAQTYVYKVTNGSKGYAECSVDVSVVEVAPTITCPDDMAKSVGATVSVTPKSLSGCASGCYYTIDGTGASGSGYTGGAVSFTGASSAGTSTYTFNVSNSKGSASCNFNVEYSASATIDITASYGSYQSYTPGKCYSITMAGGNVWRCTAGSQSTTRFIGVFNSSNFNIEAWQTQATTTNPGSGSVVEFCVDDNAPTDLQCANDW